MLLGEQEEEEHKFLQHHFAMHAMGPLQKYDYHYHTISFTVNRSQFSAQAQFQCNAITSVLYNLGMVVTASQDGKVLLHSPGGSHELVCTLEERTSAPTGLDFSRNTLAVAGGDRNVSLWTHSVSGSFM